MSRIDPILTEKGLKRKGKTVLCLVASLVPLSAVVVQLTPTDSEADIRDYCERAGPVPPPPRILALPDVDGFEVGVCSAAARKLASQADSAGWARPMEAVLLREAQQMVEIPVAMHATCRTTICGVLITYERGDESFPASSYPCCIHAERLAEAAGFEGFQNVRSEDPDQSGFLVLYVGPADLIEP